MAGLPYSRKHWVTWKAMMHEAPNKGGAERIRKYRNLSFKSKIKEAYVAAEIYPLFSLNNMKGLKA